MQSPLFLTALSRDSVMWSCSWVVADLSLNFSGTKDTEGCLSFVCAWTAYPAKHSFQMLPCSSRLTVGLHTHTHTHTHTFCQRSGPGISVSFFYSSFLIHPIWRVTESCQLHLHTVSRINPTAIIVISLLGYCNSFLIVHLGAAIPSILHSPYRSQCGH